MLIVLPIFAVVATAAEGRLLWKRQRACLHLIRRKFRNDCVYFTAFTDCCLLSLQHSIMGNGLHGALLEFERRGRNLVLQTLALHTPVVDPELAVNITIGMELV